LQALLIFGKHRGVEDRPWLEYMASNLDDLRRSAASAIFLMARSGWSMGISAPGHPTNIITCSAVLARISHRSIPHSRKWTKGGMVFGHFGFWTDGINFHSPL
jgi:hypothetical protein